MNSTRPFRASPVRALLTATAPDLVDRLIAHDEDAFADLVRLHGPRMLAVATRYLRNSADAEDALQDAFVSVVRSIARFQRASKLETWLHRIVVNCSLMSLRRRRRKPDAYLDATALESGSALPRRSPPPPPAQVTLETEELAGDVRAAIALLPEGPRALLMLRDVQSHSLRDIGELLKIETRTVKFKLRGARQALRHAVNAETRRPFARHSCRLLTSRPS